jgi:class 3 adenylate cyclase
MARDCNASVLLIGSFPNWVALELLNTVATSAACVLPRPQAERHLENAMSEATGGLHVDERRLAAILAADVAGYSRLMGRDEEETVRELEAHQAAILPLIAKHGGSIVNIAGDGVVAQFPSAVRAVECAVAIQKIMAERNFDVPADRRMLLRIGVNLGDIIHDGTRSYGDGINVAARLEPLAEPGGHLHFGAGARGDLRQARPAVA